MIINIVHMLCLKYLIPTMCLWQKFLVKVNDDLKIKGYNFNHVTEMTISSLAKKMDMLYDFYIRQNMHAVEWKLNAMINKSKSLISKLNHN